MPGRLLAFAGKADSRSPPRSRESSANRLSPGRESSTENNLTAKKAGMDALKRHSLRELAGKGKERKEQPGGQSGGPSSVHRSPRLGATSIPSPKLQPLKPINKLELVLESPPNTFHGNPQQATGALFSARLVLEVVDPELTLKSLTGRFFASITPKRPVVKECKRCTQKTTDLYKWTFITKPKEYSHGRHELPFSYLIPGHLPATTRGHLGTLEYFMEATATTKNGEVFKLRQDITLSRSLQPVHEKNSQRVFPPTNINAHVTLAPVIHPIGQFQVLLRIDGMTSRNDTDLQMRWRLRKLTWRIEETEVMISPACAEHAEKLGGQGKGIQHTDTRTIGREEIKHGWKTDFTAGQVELDFACQPYGNPRPICDVDSPTGLSVKHMLVIELVVMEEWAPHKKPTQATPTGAARVLRAQFPVMVTERAGLGISWDEEQPPMYEDVPASPPRYLSGAQQDDLAPPLEGLVERFRLDPSPNRVGTSADIGPPPEFSET